MASSKITLIGFDHFMKSIGSDLFADLKLPEGLDKQTFRDSLVMHSGEFEVLYADPYFMQEAIGVWGRKWYDTFAKWLAVLEEEYDPLHNYNRYEGWTDKEATDETVTKTEKETVEETEGIDTTNSVNSSGESSTDSTGENKLSAYNSSVYEPDTMNTDNTDSTMSSTSSETGSSDRDRNEETNKNAKDITDNDRQLDHTGHMYGNIGVTTTQSMLKQELEIRRWNIYNSMIDLFNAELLVPVYS